MITPVLTCMTEQCPVCGDIACERDLVYVDGDDATALDVDEGDIVCADCAGSDAR